MDEESDVLYQEFIKSFLEEQADRNNASTSGNDGQNETDGGGLQLSFLDDEDDPEYNVFQDLSTLDFDEFLQFLKDDPIEPGNVVAVSSDGGSIITDDQLIILQNQLSFHVQNLTQVWLLSASFDTELMEQTKKMLYELKESPNRRFMSYVGNLAPAIALIEQQGDLANEGPRYEFKTLSNSLRKLFATRRDIFQFEWALPVRRFIGPNSRAIFPPSIDSLIAFALDEYNKIPKRRRPPKFRYIHQRYLPTHSMTCIRTHVKNLRRGLKSSELKPDEKESPTSQNWLNNPIIRYYREKQAPDSNLYFCTKNRDHFDRLGTPPRWYTQMTDKDERSLCIDEKPSSSPSSPESTGKRKTESLLLPKGMQFSQPFASVVATTAATMVMAPVQIIPVNNIQAHLEEIRNDTKRRKNAHRKTKKESAGKQQSVPPKPASQNCDNHGKSITTTTISVVMNHEDPGASETVESPPIESKPEPNEFSDETDMDNVPEMIEPPMDLESNVERNEYYEETDMDENYGFLDEDDGPDEDCLDDEDEVEKEDDGPDENMMIDDENDLIALMQASWTTVTNRNLAKDGGDQASKRKSEILALHRESSKFLLQNDQRQEQDQASEQNELLINYYLKRSRKLLSEADYVRFLELISGFAEDNPVPVTQVYRQIKKFLRESKAKYIADGNVQQPILDGIQELIELLVLFLDFFQAQQCGQAFQYLYWRRIFDFFRKVELYLSFVYPTAKHQRHGCIQRLVRSLNQLVAQQSTEANYSAAKVKAAFSKILNHHPLLMREFSALFLDEPPSPHLYADDEDFDEFTLPHDDSEDLDMDYDSAVVPVDESDLKYGTNECPCRECHQQDTQQDGENFGGHCSACSIRFISGRIYLPQMNQNNKKLQLVEYVKSGDDAELNRKSDALQTIDLNVKPEPEIKSQKSAWTMVEDRLLLQACRSMIVDSNITTLTEQVIRRVATNLARERDFGQRRSVDEITERLVNLIEMLTTTGSSSSN